MPTQNKSQSWLVLQARVALTIYDKVSTIRRSYGCHLLCMDVICYIWMSFVIYGCHLLYMFGTHGCNFLLHGYAYECCPLFAGVVTFVVFTGVVRYMLVLFVICAYFSLHAGIVCYMWVSFVTCGVLFVLCGVLFVICG